MATTTVRLEPSSGWVLIKSAAVAARAYTVQVIGASTVVVVLAPSAPAGSDITGHKVVEGQPIALQADVGDAMYAVSMDANGASVVAT